MALRAASSAGRLLMCWNVRDMVEGNFRSCYEFETSKKLHGFESLGA